MIKTNILVQAHDDRGQIIGMRTMGRVISRDEPRELLDIDLDTDDGDGELVTTTTRMMVVHVNVLMPVDAIVVFLIWLDGARPPVVSPPFIFGTPYCYFSSGDDG